MTVRANGCLDRWCLCTHALVCKKKNKTRKKRSSRRETQKPSSNKKDPLWLPGYRRKSGPRVEINQIDEPVTAQHSHTHSKTQNTVHTVEHGTTRHRKSFSDRKRGDFTLKWKRQQSRGTWVDVGDSNELGKKKTNGWYSPLSGCSYGGYQPTNRNGSFLGPMNSLVSSPLPGKNSDGGPIFQSGQKLVAQMIRSSRMCCICCLELRL